MPFGELNSYLFVVDTTQNSLDAAVEAVDSSIGLENWYKFTPGAAVLVSSLLLPELTRQVRETLPKQRFLLTQLERGKKNGWLPKPVWELMNRPVPA